ncbi:MAG: hypothetical protein QNJ54_32845 [Prochloraceae cyanobacterium]|nr:hypothetical protein [Prochloraceae cyanobacterium]
MTISRELWQSNRDISNALLSHPFIIGTATGNLDRKCFMFYVGQDAFFLEAFARAYSITAAKAPDWQGFTSFHQLADGVLEELRLHQNYP